MSNNWNRVIKPDEPIITIEDEPITVKREIKLGMEVYCVYIGINKVNQFFGEPSARSVADRLLYERTRKSRFE